MKPDETQFIYLQNHITGIVNVHPVFSMKECATRANVSE